MTLWIAYYVETTVDINCGPITTARYEDDKYFNYIVCRWINETAFISNNYIQAVIDCPVSQNGFKLSSYADKYNQLTSYLKSFAS